MQPTIERVLEAIWEAPPEVSAALDYQVRLLTALAPDGLCDLQRFYAKYPIENERDDAIERMVSKRLAELHEGQWIIFQADTAETGGCLFRMRAASTHAGLKDARWAKNRFNLKLFFD